MSQNLDLLIHNVVIINEGTRSHGYVGIRDKVIEVVGTGVPDQSLIDCAQEVTDGAGGMLLPGAIDTHVHFREPGLTQKADIASESRAAVWGGITSFVDMPNTIPPTTTMEAVETKLEIGARSAYANYGFFIGATNTNLEELMLVDYTRVAGIKLFMGSSTGGMLVEGDNRIRQIFEKAPAIIAVHAESEDIIRRNRDAAKTLMGEDLPISMHPRIRSREACVAATQTAVSLAREYDARLHVCHVSTADEAQLFAPGDVSGKRITAETAPQYLLFNSSHYASRGSRIKCNPAVKDEADRTALLEAVADGRINTIATDHAPHLPNDKQGNALTAASGMPMIQFSVVLMAEMALRGLLPIETVVQRMSHDPARIFGIERRGFIRKGAYADLILLATDCEPWTITDDTVISKCGWTPAVGITLHCRVASTWVNGQLVARHGIVFDRRAAMPLKFQGNLRQDTPD